MKRSIPKIGAHIKFIKKNAKCTPVTLGHIMAFEKNKSCTIKGVPSTVSSVILKLKRGLYINVWIEIAFGSFSA